MCLGLVVSSHTQRIYIDFGVGFTMCLFIRSVPSSRRVKPSTVHMKLVAHLIRARVFDRNAYYNHHISGALLICKIKLFHKIIIVFYSYIMRCRTFCWSLDIKHWTWEFFVSLRSTHRSVEENYICFVGMFIAQCPSKACTHYLITVFSKNILIHEWSGISISRNYIIFFSFSRSPKII